MMRKPDNVADNPGLLPYGSNIGAPSIKIDNVDGWKKSNVFKVNKELNTRFEELKNQYQKLIEDYEWNQLVYSAHYNFEPIIGETYHLYRNNDKIFLSLIKPEEWKLEYLGSFKLDSNNKWNKLDEIHF
jgi:hypothetical protein